MASHLSFANLTPTLPRPTNALPTCHRAALTLRMSSTTPPTPTPTPTPPSPAPRRRIRTAVITGASGGIGACSARRLAAAYPDATFYLAVRDVPKTTANVTAHAPNPANIHPVPCDLTSLASTAACRDRIAAAVGAGGVDLVLCNAGIMAPPFGTVYGGDGVEGAEVEQQWGVNYLSQMLLVAGVLPAVRRAKGRVVMVSSSAAGMARGRERLEVVPEVDEVGYAKWRAYGESKLAQAVAAVGMREVESGITAVSLHPGIVNTELQRFLVPEWMKANAVAKGALWVLSKAVGLKTPEQGSDNSVYCATAPDEEIVNGGYYFENKDNSKYLPILSNTSECVRFYEATMRHLESVSANLSSHATP